MRRVNRSIPSEDALLWDATPQRWMEDMPVNRVRSFWRCEDLGFKSGMKKHSKAEVSTGMKREVKSQHTYN